MYNNMNPVSRATDYVLITSILPPYPMTVSLPIKQSPLYQMLLTDKNEQVGEYVDRNVNVFALARFFSDRYVTSMTNGLLMSGFLLKDAMKAIIIAGLSDDEYIVGLTYTFVPSLENLTGEGDTQLFLTGNVKNNETHEVTTIRKIEDATKLTPIKSNSIMCIDTNSDDIKWYKCSISLLKPLKYSDHKSKSECPDNNSQKKKKVACLIHDTYEEMVLKLSELTQTNVEPFNGISGITCIKVTDVKKIITMIYSENYGPFDKFFWNNDTHDNIFYKKISG